MAQEYNNPDEKEIDLGEIKSKVKSAFSSMNDMFFNSILFVRRNIILLAVLFIIGAGAGFYLDRSVKVYRNEIIVIPNFGTIDYLYSKIDLIEAKIRERDQFFFNEIGIKDVRDISKIKIEPLTDIYHFVNTKERNFELLKLMAEDGDVNDVVKSSVTSKNYTFHQITFVTKDSSESKEVADALMNYINDSDYYRKMQKEFVYNLNEKIKANEAIIQQIDAILNSLSQKNTSQGVYISENSQLNDVIITKDRLIEQQGNLRLSAINFSQIIKESSRALNMKDFESINGKLKYILPIVLILLFIMIAALRRYYKNQLLQRNL